MKKVIFTEDQMKHILGEDFVSYLDKEDNGCDIPTDSNIVDTEEVYDTEPGKGPKTLDKYGREKVMSNPAFVRSYYTTIYEGKKKVIKNDEGEIVPEICPECGAKVGLYIKGEPVYLCSNKKCGKYFGTIPFSKKMEQKTEKKNITERNHQLDGKKFGLGKKANDTLDTVAMNNSGDKMVNNMSDENGATANSLYVRQNRLNKMKKEDPARYARINGKQLQKSIKDTLKRATDSTKTSKNTLQDTVLNTTPNMYKGTGKGNHKEGGLTVYYEKG